MKPRKLFCCLRIVAAGQPQGFGLIEALMAILIMTFGLLSVGQLMFTALSGPLLARSKGSAALVAHDRLESLAEVFRQDSEAPDLTLGTHGPQQVSIPNPADGTVMNRFQVTWVVANVPDPRPGKILKAKRVTVTVVPINNAGAANLKSSMNKVVAMTSIFSYRPA